MASFAPTPEQENAREAFATGGTLAINAYAGTGKTSTLELLAADAATGAGRTGRGAGARRGQYVAFNKAIVTEAGRKFPAHVACNTAHSLAYRAVGKNMQHRLNAKRVKSIEIARQLNLAPFHCTTNGERKSLSAGYLGGVVMRAVTLFCQSADLEPTRRHVPYQEGIDMPADGRRTWANNRALADHLMPAVHQAWRDLMDPMGSLPYKHEHYLKAWHLGEPFIPAEFIMFDEAQDANPVLLAIVGMQDHAQRIYVGDTHQQIYTFTGAVNALETIDADVRASLTQSFRFGPAIAELANVLLAELGATEPLRGFEPIASQVGPITTPDAILTRTNARAVTELLNAIREGRRPHLVGGGKEVTAFARAVVDLQRDGWTSYPDLACFTSWGEVQEYVEQDAQGGELRLMVKLVDEFGTSTIIEALERMPPERNAGLVISTAHKAKGREWHRVQLASDFPDPASDARSAGSMAEEGVADEELRLLYVAVTRGQLGVDVSKAGYFTTRTAAQPELPAQADAASWYETTTGKPTEAPEWAQPTAHLGGGGGPR